MTSRLRQINQHKRDLHRKNRRERQGQGDDPDIELPETARDLRDLIRSNPGDITVAAILEAEKKRGNPRKTVISACKKALNG